MVVPKIAMRYLASTVAIIKQGDRQLKFVKIKKYNIIFKEINEIRGPNYVALQGNFLVNDEKKNIITKLKPEIDFIQ